MAETSTIAAPENAPSLPVQSLSVLVRRLAAGEQTALAELYDLTVAKIFGLAILIVRDAQDAEEVVCDTFVQVWHEARRYDPARGSALAWLLSICRSRAIDRRRRNQVGALAAAADDAQDLHQAGADDLLEALEPGSAIHDALSQLSPTRLQLISLAFFQGLTYEEIARETSLPVGTVKSHIRRALAAMRSTLCGGGEGA